MNKKHPLPPFNKETEKYKWQKLLGKVKPNHGVYGFMQKDTLASMTFK
jgi:hypothetical protein